MPKDVRAKDVYPEVSGFIFVRPLSRREVRLYYNEDIDVLVDYLSTLDVDEKYKNADFWKERANDCHPVLRIEKRLRQGLSNSKRRFWNKFEFTFTGHCVGGCTVPGHVCRRTVPKEVGRICECQHPLAPENL